jgi:hypothetical protein
VNTTFDPQTLADDLCEVHRIYTLFLPLWMKVVGINRQRVVPKNGPCMRLSRTCAP